MEGGGWRVEGLLQAAGVTYPGLSDGNRPRLFQQGGAPE